MTPVVYRPSRGMLTLSITACLVFIAFTALAFWSETGPFYSYTLAGLSLLSLAGPIELLASRLVLDADGVTVVGLFRRRTVSFDDLERAQIDGGLLFLHLAAGETMRMPPWLHQTRSARRRIGDRIKAAKAAKETK